jgi:hypothetical protein
MPEILALTAANKRLRAFDNKPGNNLEEAERLRYEAEILMRKADVIFQAEEKLRSPYVAAVDAAMVEQRRALTGWLHRGESLALYHNRYRLPVLGGMNTEPHNNVAWLRFMTIRTDYNLIGRTRLTLDVRSNGCQIPDVRYGRKIWEDMGKESDLSECFRLADQELVDRGFILTDWLEE